MDESQIRQIFADCEAIITDGHFVYTKGDHGSVYVNKDAIYPYVRKIDALCRLMAGPFSILEWPVDTVIAPALGGITLSQRVASHLSDMQGNDVMSIFAEKVAGKLTITRDQAKHVSGKLVLVVEDILNTGGSVKDVITLVRDAGGKVVGVATLCNRGGVTREELGVRRLEALLNVTLEKYPEADCPLCKSCVPVNTNVGKGKEFLARKRALQ